MFLFGRAASSCFYCKANLQWLCIICAAQKSVCVVWCWYNRHTRQETFCLKQAQIFSQGKPFFLQIFCKKIRFSISVMKKAFVQHGMILLQKNAVCTTQMGTKMHSSILQFKIHICYVKGTWPACTAPWCLHSKSYTAPLNHGSLQAFGLLSICQIDTAEPSHQSQNPHLWTAQYFHTSTC